MTDISYILEELNSARVDGRLDNLAFKHKQLYALFAAIQDGGPAVVGNGDHSQLLLELEMTLRSISDALVSLPNDLPGKHTSDNFLKDVDTRGNRRTGLGVIMVLADEAHPFASWAIPLSQAIAEGNPCFIVTQTGRTMFAETCLQNLDRTAFQSQQIGKQQVEKILGESTLIRGVIGTAGRLPDQVVVRSASEGSFVLVSLKNGPVPVVIDQSVVTNVVSVQQNYKERGIIPTALSSIAGQVAEAIQLGGEEKSSLGAPRYVLLHENVAPPFEEAIRTILSPAWKVQCEALEADYEKAKSILGTPKSGKSKYLTIYTIRSIDEAMDFIQNEVPLPPAAYLFSSRRFGGYVFTHMSSVPALGLNATPRENLALGPYADSTLFALSSQKSITISGLQRTRLSSTINDIEGIKARRLVQAPGNRIDFFGGGFLFAGSLAASVVLGSFGYGVYKIACYTWTAWKSR
ncbi:uncharacterized protein I303_106930 [Kwoniella dejecticola CBS 10117]|uniref:Aldehyde dehydrogenase domain-containing protein n=1 Tax=Kwoniella dejecticola CBS 10117 TaxID=1296121 RepID=A0A1A5ZTA7_9TREE|nr:uncharacterized protein I303_08431 [Kwoniella dejecticola CBS 10117]OBR81049.1 hypothetical protein I303_08431 [Kwoniella dejecticola CBS 10117]